MPVPIGPSGSHQAIVGLRMASRGHGFEKPCLTLRSLVLKTQETPLNLRRRKETPLPISGLFEG